MSFTPAVQAKKGQDNADEFLHVQTFAPAAPVAEGKVSRLLINPFGEVDGLLLDTGTLVTFPKYRHLHYGKHGEINGVILSDGTSIRFPHEVSYQFEPMLRIGQSITASGYGTKNQYGKALEATELGFVEQQDNLSYSSISSMWSKE